MIVNNCWESVFYDFICSENKESDSHPQWVTALGRDYLEFCVNWDPIKRAAAQIVSPSSWRWLSLLSGNYRCCHWFSLLQRCHENTLQMECQAAVTGNSWCITSQHRLKWWHLCKNIESENKKVQKYLMAASFPRWLCGTITDNSSAKYDHHRQEAPWPAARGSPGLDQGKKQNWINWA